MNADEAFRLALAGSLVLHLGLLAGSHGWLRRPAEQADQYPVEVTYFEIAEEPLIQEADEPAAAPEPDRSELGERAASAATEARDTDEVPVTAAPPEDTAQREVPAAVDLTQLPDAATDEPAYLDYFRAIRERIRVMAMRYRPRRWVEGEVHLSFTVAASGHVMRIRILDPGSSAHYALRQASISSIQHASPFPPFPRNIPRDQITFNITISFELSR